MSPRQNVDDSIVAAGAPAIRPARPLQKHFHELPPGGKTSISAQGALTVNDDAPRQAQSSRVGPGGKSTLVLGDWAHTYECGSKEAHFRLAQSEELKQAAAAEVAAGRRVSDRVFLEGEPSRALLASPRLVGGHDSIPTILNEPTGPGAYREGMDEAQRRAALDPAAKEAAAAVVVAGKRVERAGVGLRVSGQGRQTHDLTRWAEQSVPTPNTPDRNSKALKIEHPVGGASSQYLPVTYARAPEGSMRNLLSQGADEANTSTHRSGMRRVPDAYAAGSTVGSMLLNDGMASGRKQITSVQPVGGRGLLAAGLHGLDAPDAKVGGKPQPAHASSSIQLG